VADEAAIRALLDGAAVEVYGEQRARELGGRLNEIARWLWLIEQQPLDLLDEEPDNGGR
jgi:hypothetical protein